MDFILHIETSTSCCSLSISSEANTIDTVESKEGNLHAEELHNMTQELLQKNHLENVVPLAVSVGTGPGSYTGMRIGTSFAKGLCFGYGVPLIGINSLEGMTHRAKKIQTSRAEDALWIPMIDAGRMEVYCNISNHRNELILPTTACILDDHFVQAIPVSSEIFFFGNGAEKAIPVMKVLTSAVYLNDVYCSSADHAMMAWEKYHKNQIENLDTFDPQYLKEFVVKTKK